MERSSVSAMYKIPSREHGANLAVLIKDRKWKTGLAALTGILGDQFHLFNISFAFNTEHWRFASDFEELCHVPQREIRMEYF